MKFEKPKKSEKKIKIKKWVFKHNPTEYIRGLKSVSPWFTLQSFNTDTKSFLHFSCYVHFQYGNNNTLFAIK